MVKSKIEYCDFTINPIKGLCPGACPYCYERARIHRFGLDPEPRLNLTEFALLQELIERSSKSFPNHRYRFFVGSLFDIFHPSLDPRWLETIMRTISLPCFRADHHRYLFLTKFPARILELDQRLIVPNHLIGVSITGREDLWRLDMVRKYRGWISFEPLLGPIGKVDLRGLSWIVIGGLNRPAGGPVHRAGWIYEILEEALRWTIPVFLKDNLEIEGFGRDLILGRRALP